MDQLVVKKDKILKNCCKGEVFECLVFWKWKVINYLIIIYMEWGQCLGLEKVFSFVLILVLRVR